MYKLLYFSFIIIIINIRIIITVNYESQYQRDKLVNLNIIAYSNYKTSFNLHDLK